MSHKNKITGRVTGTAAMPAEDMKWRAEDDLRTLSRAQEIQKDRARMKAAKTCAREQIKTLSKVTAPKKR